MAIEIPCTLRCDRCGETKPVNLPMTAQYSSHSFPVHARSEARFLIDESRLPDGWALVPGPTDTLQCPRCNGVK